VFHAQSADDEVMPKDLMDRTWHYLRLESGANVVAMRTSGPHDVSHEVSEGLQRWLTVVEPRLGEA
jgi:phospholipase/carboxylesterase